MRICEKCKNKIPCETVEEMTSYREVRFGKDETSFEEEESFFLCQECYREIVKIIKK